MIKRTAAFIALTIAPAVFAQTYIVPDRNCGAVTFHATRDADFPDLGRTIAADRVATAKVILEPIQKIPLQPFEAARSLDFQTLVPEAGAAMAAVDFKPETIGNETRTEHAKAFVKCGGASPGPWRLQTGLGLEIFPQWNEGFPLKKGHEMRFIVLDKATHKLPRDVPMELYRAGAGHVGTGVPDGNGLVPFPDKAPGRYLVTATYRRVDPEKPEHWLVDTSSFTFEIK